MELTEFLFLATLKMQFLVISQKLAVRFCSKSQNLLVLMEIFEIWKKNRENWAKDGISGKNSQNFRDSNKSAFF